MKKKTLKKILWITFNIFLLLLYFFVLAVSYCLNDIVYSLILAPLSIVIGIIFAVSLTFMFDHYKMFSFKDL